MITGQSVKAAKLSGHKELSFLVSVGFQGSFCLAGVPACRLKNYAIICLSRFVSPLLKQEENFEFLLTSRNSNKLI